MYKEARAISIKICLTNLLEDVSSRVVVVHWLCCVIVIAMLMIHLGHHRRQWKTWERVPATEITKWMEVFRNIAIQTDMMKRNGFDSWLEWEEMYALCRGGRCPWDDLRF